MEEDIFPLYVLVIALAIAFYVSFNYGVILGMLLSYAVIFGILMAALRAHSATARPSAAAARLRAPGVNTSIIFTANTPSMRVYKPCLNTPSTAEAKTLKEVKIENMALPAWEG